MTPPFFLLLAAAGIFRLLSAEAKRSFAQGLANLVPRNVSRDHLRVLVQEFPERTSEFRRRIAPRFVLHVLYNAAAAGAFAAALWIFAPTNLAPQYLSLVQRASLLLLPVALLADMFMFVKMMAGTVNRGDTEPDGAV